VLVGQARDEAEAVLAASGVRDPDRDADRLLRHLLGWDAATLFLRDREEVAPDVLLRYRELVVRRASRIPLQHLIGLQAFWRHEFVVSPDVLVPRPETELLVEIGLELLRDRARPVIVDVGTGSGCIALSLAAERPDAVVHAIDLSPAALAVARANARRLGLSERVAFHEGDLLAPLPGPCCDLVVSNPPYVDPVELQSLEPEVRDHEPRLALCPRGEDPLALYARLAAQAASALVPGGHLAVEIGMGMEGGVAAAFEAAGLVVDRVAPDLAGIARVVVARRTGPPVPP
jgi:release factor glutamine methyltransferase